MNQPCLMLFSVSCTDPNEHAGELWPDLVSFRVRATYQRCTEARFGVEYRHTATNMAQHTSEELATNVFGLSTFLEYTVCLLDCLGVDERGCVNNSNKPEYIRYPLTILRVERICNIGFLV